MLQIVEAKGQSTNRGRSHGWHSKGWGWRWIRADWLLPSFDNKNLFLQKRYTKWRKIGMVRVQTLLNSKSSTPYVGRGDQWNDAGKCRPTPTTTRTQPDWECFAYSFQIRFSNDIVWKRFEVPAAPVCNSLEAAFLHWKNALLLIDNCLCNANSATGLSSNREKLNQYVCWFENGQSHALLIVAGLGGLHAYDFII